MNNAVIADLIVNIIIAIGTIGAVIVALFGESIKRFFSRAELLAEILDVNGELTDWLPYGSNQILARTIPNPSVGRSGYGGRSGTSGTHISSSREGGKRVIYYHLRIVNKKPSIIVEKCRVLLKEIYKRNTGTGQFNRLPLIVPPLFSWAPAETSAPAIDFVTDQVLDFGYITEGSNLFTPSVNPRFNNFKGDLQPNETFRYVLEIQANNSSPKKITIEVSWNGTWNEDLEEMANGFTIKII
jgi:hypothetical protein